MGKGVTGNHENSADLYRCRRLAPAGRKRSPKPVEKAGLRG